jgi:hypothetical protein
MDELIEQLRDRTGLDPAMIQKVVAGVADFLGDKLPGPLGDQVHKLLGTEHGDAAPSDGPDAGDLIDKAKDMLGGLLGGN